MAFPLSPADLQTYVSGDWQYQFDAANKAWKKKAPAVGGKPIPIPTAADTGKVLQYDDATGAYKYIALTTSSNATTIQNKSIPAPTSTENLKVIQYNNTSGAFQYADISGIGNATKIQGKNVPSPTSTEDKKFLQYDHTLGAFTFTTPPTGTNTVSSGDSGNYTVAYGYNTDGKIATETYTGDVNKVINYTYYDNTSEFAGKVEQEITTQGAQTITKVYSYETGTGRIQSVTVTTA